MLPQSVGGMLGIDFEAKNVSPFFLLTTSTFKSNNLLNIKSSY